MRQLKDIQILYAIHFDSLPKNDHKTRARFLLHIPTQIDTDSAGKSTLVLMEIGTCSEANRHALFRVS